MNYDVPNDAFLPVALIFALAASILAVVAERTRFFPRAPLGFVPEANLASNVPPARFWHDSLPGGGMVLTWENALVDRLPGRPVSLQVELRPSGDCAFRYDFPNESVTVTLNSAVPAEASASLMVGGLCIPLRSPSSWTLGLVPGELYPYRLVVGGDTPVDLSIGPGETTPPMRGNMDAMSIALWLDGMGGTFDGWSLGGSGNMAIPTLNVQWVDPGDGSHDETGVGVCLHSGTEAVFTPTLHPEAVHDQWQLNDLTERNGNLVLSVPDAGIVYYGSATLLSSKIRFGVLVATVSAHRCDSTHSSPFCSICGHYQPDDLTLSVRSPLTLKHDNQTTICFVHTNSPGVSIGNTVVEIRRKNTSTWETLGTESSLNPWTAKIAGTFELRGTGTVDGRSVETPIAEVEVRFPSFSQITNDATVVAFTDAAWLDTLSDCSPTNRRERGFWIYLDTQTSSYYAGNTVFGPWVNNFQGAYVNLPVRPEDLPALPLPTAAGARYPVASFHCHTPTTYRTQGRGIGPSPDDNQADTTDNVPGIVYDYVEDFPGSGSIPGGHPLNSSAQLYKSLGVERRPTPVYP